MINSLTLTDFRNHTHSRIKTGGHKNIIITGPNGSGKTAVLEALSMLGGDKGLRGAGLPDIARFTSMAGFSAFASLADDTEISISWRPGDSNRRVTVDGDSAPINSLGQHLRIVWITPREDRLFLDSVSDRRSFFDRLVSGFDPVHLGRTAKLGKLLSERAFALKSGANKNWLDAIDKQIAGTAVSVACARVAYSAEINYFLENCAVSITGLLEAKQIAASDQEREYFEYLVKNRELTSDKMQIDGAHKSDFGVQSHAHGLAAGLLSTGQQKSVLLDLILAHARLINEKTGKTPIILLDEAAAHLDSRAREKLFSDLGAARAQVWATGIESEIFAGVPDSVFINCPCA